MGVGNSKRLGGARRVIIMPISNPKTSDSSPVSPHLTIFRQKRLSFSTLSSQAMEPTECYQDSE